MKNQILGIIMIVFFSRLQSQINFTDSLGRKQGQWNIYFKNKVDIKYKYFYTDNNLDLKSYEYTKKGKLKRIFYYSEGTYLFHKKIFTTGKKIGSVESIHGEKVNNIISKYMYDYDSSGIYTKIGEINNLGLKVGIWHEIYVGSILSPSPNEYYSIGKYINGKRDGKWKFYLYETKQLEYELEFFNDTINGKTTVYFLNGNIAVLYNYKMGKKDGEYLSFFENGTKRETGYFKDNKYFGEYYRYNKKGKIVKYIRDSNLTSPLMNW